MEEIKTTIEIDCAPFTPRPDEYFKYICNNILECDYYEPISKCFGCWEWDVTYKSKDQQDKVKTYLTGCYHKDLIRYASW